MLPKSNRARGRPAGDPDDVRTERIALRLHPNLVVEMNVLARLEGISRSVLIEKMLLRLVNDHYNRTVVDRVGRYVDGPPKEDNPVRVRETVTRTFQKQAPRKKQTKQTSK